MLGSIPVVSPLFQGLLDVIGAILAWLYSVIPNYGVAIILLTVLIRIVLLPLGIKQIKSMQAMQAIQPKVKELQRKYKGNKTKIQEETMKLYKEHGVNPLGGCLPLLLQFPILIAMYAVIRPPLLQPATFEGQPAYAVHNNHLPEDSQLFENVITQQDTDFLWMNLQCSASTSGKLAPNTTTARTPVVPGRPLLGKGGVPLRFDGTQAESRHFLDCGLKPIVKIPYFIFLAAMIATTWYQQRQMQQASPPGTGSQQQQAITKVMPFLFGVWGYLFPAGLLVYWTTSNLWQIGQQFALLKAGHIGPDALERRRQELSSKPAKRGFFTQMMDKAQQAGEGRRQQQPRNETTMRKPGARKPPPGGRPTPKKKGGGSGGQGNGTKRPKR